MGCLPRRPEPAAIDITWVSCRGVRSSLPFHTPCLYASVCVTPSSAGKNVRRRRVKTPTDRAGGENPEWDERLRLHLPDDASSEQEAAGNKKDRGVVDRDDGVLLVRFELKAEVAVLGDVLAASAVVPLSDLVDDGRTRRVSYQLAASADGRQHNGVISFSYAFHHGSTVDDDHSSDGEPVSPASPAPPPPPPHQSTVSSSGMYPVMDWGPLEQLAVYPPQLNADTATCSSSPEPIAVYPPLQETSSRGIYPMLGEPESSLYPTVDFAPVSCYTPTTAPYYYGGGLYG
ncbi:hypothetical protein ZWY2020_047783 [Hordeum vulgare]|uniref:Predicted protein n=1 Tax=Hordeum vulgare subsp. vulgare TaxID=112509 RepID=F2E1I5_HORVV|nr:hypothetical protein ZWY2020_047783 [Hordeum vulgare]BAK01207.1 predicted protein [Hordeum vulgare subsp. vulgare]BAK03465.1 predicted protein [Hordeum vulgare subsp. vulgare]